MLAPLLPVPSSTGLPGRWKPRVIPDGIFCWTSRLEHGESLIPAPVAGRRVPAPRLCSHDGEPPAGRARRPTGCVMDAQAARSGGVGMAGERGYDPARRSVGRKRHALTDKDGHLHAAGVSPADLHGGIALLPTSYGLFHFLTHCFVGRADRGERVCAISAAVVEIVEPVGRRNGPAVQPRGG